MPPLWVRVVCTVVAAFVMSASTLAWALPPCSHDAAAAEPDEAAGERDSGCCDHGAPNDGSPDDSDGDDGDEPCSCPLPCAPCCGSAVAPALLPSVVDPPVTLAWTTLDFRVVTAAPPEIPPGDVLHVPKPRASFRR